MRRGFLCLTGLAGFSATASGSAPTPHNFFTISTRILQDEAGSSYAYLDDVSQYYIQYSSCVRVKIPNQSDDDQTEGNINFYNGRYHAQYNRYATFHLCSNDGMQCSCDYSVEYATTIEQYLKSSLEYLNQYCGNNECKNFNVGDDNLDESQYINCAAGYQDEDGVQYYYAPQCDDYSNGIVIGVFYDDECSIKTKNTGPDFNYYKFQTIESTCMDCGQDGFCNELYKDSYHCLDGKDASGLQNANVDVCNTVKKAMMSHDYSSVKKRRSGTDAFLKVFFSLLIISLSGAFVFLTYTYYVRHKDGKVPLIQADHLSHSEKTGATSEMVSSLT